MVSTAMGLVRSRLPPSVGLVVDSWGAAGETSIGSVITNSRPGELQWFDSKSGKNRTLVGFFVWKT